MQGGKQGIGRSIAAANAFPDGWGNIPDSPLIAASIAALSKGGRRARSLIGGWSADNRGRPSYRHMADDGGEIVVSVHPDAAWARHGDSGLTRQWSFVEAISPLTIDVLLAVLARSCAQRFDDRSTNSQRTPVQLTARDILRYKGVVQWGTEGAALRRRVDDEIRRLHGLRFRVRRPEAGIATAGRRNTRSLPGESGRLFDIVESTTIRATRKKSARRPETAWAIRPGWRSGAGEDPRDQVRAVSLPQALLQFDHRRNRGAAVLAKKIGLNISVLWGGVQWRGSVQRRICDLLQEIGELPRRDGRGVGWGARMRDRFTQAIVLLQEAGMLGRVAWQDGYGPEDLERNRGWVATWLNSRVVLGRPEPRGVPCDGSAMRLRKKRGSRQSRSGLLELHRGSVIRAMRTKHKIRQYQLARELGISAAYLSQIENERRMASQAVLERIAGWASRSGGAEQGRSDRPGAVALLEPAASGWRSVGTGGPERKIESTFLQVSGPCGPAGKDDRT